MQLNGDNRYEREVVVLPKIKLLLLRVFLQITVTRDSSSQRVFISLRSRKPKVQNVQEEKYNDRMANFSCERVQIEAKTSVSTHRCVGMPYLMWPAAWQRLKGEMHSEDS